MKTEGFTTKDTKSTKEWSRISLPFVFFVVKCIRLESVK